MNNTQSQIQNLQKHCLVSEVDIIKFSILVVSSPLTFLCFVYVLSNYSGPGLSPQPSFHLLREAGGELTAQYAETENFVIGPTSFPLIPLYIIILTQFIF